MYTIFNRQGPIDIKYGNRKDSGVRSGVVSSSNTPTTAGRPLIPITAPLSFTRIGTRLFRWFACLALLFTFLAGAIPASRADETIKVGALLSLTGDWSTLGEASKAAMTIAVRDINKELEANGSRARVELIIEDTKLDPKIALTKFKSLTDRGVGIIVGPQSSSELREIQPLALKKKVLVISQGSTASALAFKNDAVFRFCPTDVHEGAATAALMQADGIEAVVPIWRGDAGNDGLESSTSSAFIKLGGVSRHGVRYPAESPNLSSVVAQLTSKVRAAKQKYGTKKVAVYLASFDEGIDILALARGNSVLSSVLWYGGDGLTQSQGLLKNNRAAAFARSVRFATPALAVDPEAIKHHEAIIKEIKKRIGFEPDAFALAAYDATYVGYLACIAVRKANDIDALQAAFARSADRYWGASGATTLDAAGDRDQGSYDFYTVKGSGGSRSWVYTSTYAGGEIFPAE